MPNGRLKDVAMLVWITALLLGAALTGCAAPGNGSPGASRSDLCTIAKNGAAQADLAVANVTNAVAGTQEALAAVPTNDPLRKVLEPKLTKLSAVLFDARLAAMLARMAIASFCPEVPPPPPVVVPPTPPVVVPPPATQPAGP